MKQLTVKEMEKLAKEFGYNAGCHETISDGIRIDVDYQGSLWIRFYSREQFVFWLMGICSVQMLRTNPDDFIIFYLKEMP